ncbi:sensor histidine kinase [Mycobacterium szulgai]|uniref:Histidine kinase domain-containing protein n=1 Tax=Mycobacterium szulgai TaxID=1787 RepID=A0A1X2E5G0_MYCSZ|nr:ATP-binding protein [Mycobacterium szulgai]MCV7076510.1 sensor histidine kinase [Mycobacterium szulgai]ORW95723.1 hypothetical protein AWC27_06365 [Mycobacterium szulgai]
MRSTDVEQVLRKQRLRSLQAGALMRVGVFCIMLLAMLLDTNSTRWPGQITLLSAYAAVTVCALILAFTAKRPPVTGEKLILLFALIDVGAVFGFKLLSPGGYIPLLVMALLPRMVAVELSLRLVATVLAFSIAVFAASVIQDPVIAPRLGPAAIALIVLMYGFVCSTALLVVFFRRRHVDEMAQLTTSREALLAETMTASELERRQISEAIHDGPLQDVLAARRDIADFMKVSPDAPLQDALASLHDASRLLREATFELHPAVLDQVGLAAGVEKLVSVTAARSGISIAADVDYPAANAIDPIVFGVIRELLSNVARHSRARTASVTLKVIDGVAHIDVADDGIGISGEVATRRLAQGHIGLASHRARVEAAGGTLTIVDEPVGTHVRISLPLRY